MKWLIAILAVICLALPADACSYGASYGAGYSIGYSYAPQAVFYAQPPVQAQITYQQAPIVFQAPVSQVQYSYTAPLSTVIQYQAPLFAPVQPYFANFPVGYSGGYSSAFAYNRGFINRGFAFNNHNRGFNFNNNVGRGFSFSIRR